MKSTRYIIKIFSLLLAIATSGIIAMACGPYYNSIPSVDYLTYFDDDSHDRSLEQENLILWQRLTSNDIPLEDIRQAVYKYSLAKFINIYCRQEKTDNKFMNYIINIDRDDIFQFLYIAKKLSEKREEFTSPWYYPATWGETGGETGDFAEIIERCEKNTLKHLADRYGLQAVRAYFASGQYSKCIDYYENRMAGLPESNLFRRMSMNYVAGCWSLLGETDRANEMFAAVGDFWSIKTDDPVTFMARRNPDNPELMKYIHESYSDSDTQQMTQIRQTAIEIIDSNKCKNKGDWYFLLAYYADRYDDKPVQALRYARLALASKFSNEYNRAIARLFRMKLDADRGDMSHLLDDLLWLRQHVQPTSPHYISGEFIQNIIFLHWIPQLMKQQEYTTAVLLSGFAEHYPFEPNYSDRYKYTGTHLYGMPLYGDERNYSDYGCLTFRIMGSLTSGQLINVKKEIYNYDPLWNFLRKYARTDADYINELIGTLALREERYDRAVYYLSAVSPRYQELLNIYRDGYLSRDPFTFSPFNQQRLSSPRDAKLNFARRMLRLQCDRINAPTADRRAMAALEYAMGLRNSFEECWALTQYWKGEYLWTLSYPQYNDERVDGFDFFYEYDPQVTEERYRRQVDEAFAMFTTDEGRAAGLVLTGRYRSAVRQYPGTRIAADIMGSCDNWRDWL